jgi:cardiolipin-specific phospholipase
MNSSPYVRFASLRHWYSRSEQTYEAAEARLLSKMQYYGMEGKTTGTPGDSKTIVRIGLVDLDGDGVRKINTLVIDQIGNDFVIENGSIPSTKTSSNDPFSLESVDNELGFTPISQTNISVRSHTTAFNEKPPAKNLVMCHGFGAGLGFFYRNYHALSQVPGWRIYSIDWLGMGRSSRPKFNVKGKTVDESVEETENFFIDSLEKWRQIHKIEKMTLLGHSLGGYLAAVYALKYPEHIERLIMVSPVGIPVNPYEEFKSTTTSTTTATTSPPPPLSPGNGLRQIPKWIETLWNANLTPQSILRWTGPFGPTLVNQYTTRRFSHLGEIDRIDLHDYLYHISCAPGSGEYALSRILAPGAYARKPLIHRLNKLKMPTTFLCKCCY